MTAAEVALGRAGRIDEDTLAIAAAWVSGSGPVAYEEEVDLRAYGLAVGAGPSVPTLVSHADVATTPSIWIRPDNSPEFPGCLPD